MNLKELLNNIEFDYKIIKDDEGKNAIQLVDKTGVNLGHIEDDIFYNTADIIDRTEQYWKDYVIDDTAERLGLGGDSIWKDVYNAAMLKDDIDTDVLRCLVYPETVEIEEFKFVENTMNHDEMLIFEDLQALSNEEDSALPKFNRVKIYNPSIYGLLPEYDKIHVLAEYNGNENEDEIFNQLNDNDFPSEFNGKEIDWNPISVEQSGTIEQYLGYLVKVQEKFEKEKESYNVSNIIKETVERAVNEKLEQHNEKFYSLLKQHFPEITKEVSDIISSSMSEIESEVVINKSGVFVKDITDGKQEINRVDFATLADYALGNPLLTKEQTKILENIGQNSNNKGVNIRNNQLDSIDTERMNELAEKAYHKYQYEWLSDKGISLDDLADEMDLTLENYMEETNGERIDTWQQLREVIDNGINGEMFASLDEFKTNEFLDPKSIKLGHLLEGHEMEEYLLHIQAYAKSLGVEIDDPMKELEPVTVTKENAEIISDIPEIKIISANRLEDAIYQAKNGMFISAGEEITAAMPFDAKKNAEEKFKEELKERNERGDGNKAAFELVMDYVSGAYNLSDEQKNVVEDSLRRAEEKYYKGGYDSESRKAGEENAEQVYVDLYESLSKDSAESEEAFGWMNSSVKRNLTDDLHKKLGTALNLNTDIDIEKVNSMLKENENAVSFNGIGSVVNAVADKETFEGLYKAARAVEVAVAGKHNLVIEGKDSSARDSLAESLALYLAPDITPEEQESVEQIYSIAGLQSSSPSVPFRKPAPDIDTAGLVGGGAGLMPGEASLAHNGILFLRGAEQFRETALSALAVPLKSERVVLSRAGRSTVLPGKFQAILTMRPSPDGNYGSKNTVSINTKDEVINFRKRAVLPLYSDMEVREFFEKDDNDKRIFNPYEARERIRNAYEIQRKRGIFNHDMKDSDISKYCTLDKECADFFKNNVSKSEFSRKAAANILKVSMTLANMEGREQIRIQDLNEAYNLSLPAIEKHREIPLDKSVDSEKAKINALAGRIAGLCVGRHLASQMESMEWYNSANSELHDAIKDNAKEIKEFGKGNVLALVNQRLEKQDIDVNLVGKNQSAMDERSFVIEALAEDMGNILEISQNKKRMERKRKAEEITR